MVSLPVTPDGPLKSGKRVLGDQVARHGIVEELLGILHALPHRVRRQTLPRSQFVAPERTGLACFKPAFPVASIADRNACVRAGEEELFKAGHGDWCAW